MADKLGVLKGIIGEELYAKVLDAVGKKEGDAETAGLVNKEAKNVEAEKAKAAVDDKVEIDPKTGKPKVKPEDVKDATDKKEADEPDEALVAIFTKVVSDANAELVGRIDAMEANQAKAKKELNDALTERVGAIEVSIKEAKDGVAELLGDMPKAVKRASEAEKTATDKAQKLGEKGAGPKQDPEAFDFFSDFLLAQNPK